MLSFLHYNIEIVFMDYEMDTCFLHSVVLYFSFKKVFHRNLDFIWFNKIFLRLLIFLVGNESFRLIDKLVDRLI